MINFASTMRTPFVLLQTDYNSVPTTQSNGLSQTKSTMQFNFKRMKRFFKNSPYVFLVVVGLIVIGITIFAIKGAMANSSNAVAGVSDDTKVEVKEAIAKQTLNKEFSFPLKDAKGKQVSKLVWMIQDVELRDEIIVKGQRARSVKGRVFLIVNLKITNNYTQAVQVNSRDYLRIIVNGSPEKLAADIHNDPVEVQAISTKYTRLGLPINENDRDIVLQVGEITGKKESIKLDLK